MSEVNHEMDVGLLVGVHPTVHRSFVPRYTVHERELYFKSHFFSFPSTSLPMHTPPPFISRVNY